MSLFDQGGKLRYTTPTTMRIETKVLPANEETIGVAARILAEGSLVAFPTDTVYGVGAHAFRPDAVERIYVAKIRPRDKAIPILLAQADDLPLVAEGITETAWLLAERFWPGGLTLVLPKKASVPDVVSAGGPTIAVRVPDHPVFLALIAALGAPLAATSANLSGRPSPVTAEEVEAELGGRIELILDGGQCPGGTASTVLDLTTDPPIILRAGAVGVEKIRAIVGAGFPCPIGEITSPLQPVLNTPRNCSGWPLEGDWHLQNSTENVKPACHKTVWNDQIQTEVPVT